MPADLVTILLALGALGDDRAAVALTAVSETGQSQTAETIDSEAA